MAKTAEATDTHKRTTQRNGYRQAMESAEYRDVLEANGANMDAVMKASEAVLKGMSALGQEMVDFANQRLRQNLKASHSLMGCSDVSEVFGIQCDFLRTATQQYFDEASKLTKLASEITTESWVPIEARTKETLERLNER